MEPKREKQKAREKQVEKEKLTVCEHDDDHDAESDGESGELTGLENERQSE
jgi:hypothetical protein